MQQKISADAARIISSDRVSSSDRWLFFLFSMYCWRFAWQSHAGWDKEANRAALRLLNSISTVKVGALGRGARAHQIKRTKPKSSAFSVFAAAAITVGWERRRW